MPEKEFKKMWDIIEEPFYVLVLWSIISVIIQVNQWLSTLVISIVNWVVLIGAFSYVGYAVIKRKETVGYSAKTGAVLGVFIGLVGAVLTIISFNFFPSLYEQTLQQMAAQGIAIENGRSILQIGLYAGFITGPLFSAIIGAIISSISALVVQKTAKK